MPSRAFLGLYVAAFTRCLQVPATLLLTSPGGIEILAPSAHSARKTTSPSEMRSCFALLRPSLASPTSQVWMTLVLTVPSGSQLPLSGDWLCIPMVLPQVSLRPCCICGPVLLPLSRDRTQIALNTLKLPSLATAFWVWLSLTPLLGFLFRVFSFCCIDFLCSWLFATVGKEGWGVLVLMNVFLISYKEDFSLLSFVSHRWRCNRVLVTYS